MYGIDSTVWLKLFLLLAIIFLLLGIFNITMRRILRVERPKFFSYNHVNERHKKIDWIIRGICIVVIVIGTFINLVRVPQEPILFLEPGIVVIIFAFIAGAVRAVMERRYAKNPNAYLYTASQLAFVAVLVVSLYTTDFWGFFSEII